MVLFYAELKHHSSYLVVYWVEIFDTDEQWHCALMRPCRQPKMMEVCWNNNTVRDSSKMPFFATSKNHHKILCPTPEEKKKVNTFQSGYASIGPSLVDWSALAGGSHFRKKKKSVVTIAIAHSCTEDFYWEEDSNNVAFISLPYAWFGPTSWAENKHIKGK